jgi:phosphoribosylformimino-5-aminoimidazole carboxamide ribotide isomerase
MFVIPAVDIKGGRCVRLREGRADKETVFSEFPQEMARHWVRQGTKRLHVIDLDGAFEKKPRNAGLIEAIVKSVPVPVQLGGGIRALETIETYLALGVAQVILGTVALKKPKLLREACRLFPSHIMVSLDARDNRVAVEGWMEISQQDPIDLVKEYGEWGVKALIFTDIRRDGTRKGPAIRSTRRLARACPVPLIAAGGVSTLEDIQKLASLEKDGLIGVVTGKAIYAGSLNLREAIKWVEKNTETVRNFA